MLALAGQSVTDAEARLGVGAAEVRAATEALVRACGVAVVVPTGGPASPTNVPAAGTPAVMLGGSGTVVVEVTERGWAPAATAVESWAAYTG